MFYSSMGNSFSFSTNRQQINTAHIHIYSEFKWSDSLSGKTVNLGRTLKLIILVLQAYFYHSRSIFAYCSLILHRNMKNFNVILVIRHLIEYIYLLKCFTISKKNICEEFIKFNSIKNGKNF